MKAQSNYIKSLDGTRAIAIMLVMTFHTNIFHFGWMGVQLFFVLSGYLITGILWKEKFKEEQLSFKLKRFWARRSLRIFPLYFGYLIILGITYLIAHFPSYYTTYAPYLFTYTANYTRLLHNWQGNPLFTHLWSLSVEEQFYLFFPFIIFLLPARAIKYFLPAVIILGPLTRFFVGEYYQSRTSLSIAADAVYWNTLSHLDAFFLGGIIPIFSLDKKIKKPYLFLIVFFVIAAVAGIINFSISSHSNSYFTDLGYNHEDKYAHVWRYTCLNLLFASLILALTSINKRHTRYLRTFFENKYLVRIGRVSYGMYMFHWAISVYIIDHIYTNEHLVIKLLLFVPYVALTYGFAELSYRLYESKFLILKDKFFPKKGLKRPNVVVVNN
jgi:peptidoglycan/LPS O-acetylase OafA/YrhL